MKNFGTTLSEGGLSSRATASDFPFCSFLGNNLRLIIPGAPSPSLSICIWSQHLVMEQTFTYKYDSNGDVELVAQEKMENAVGQFQSPDVLAKMVRFSLSGVCLRARLWVSSQQLISSSEYFQRMLEDTAFPEGKKLKENGVVQIQLSELEDKMITFLLSLIFCIRGKAIYLLMSTLRCCTIPQWLWTNTSGKHWSLPRARTWFHALVRDTGLPVHFSPSLMKWLWVTWLFGLEDHFRQLSKVAQQDARNSIVPTGEAIRLPYGVLHKYSFLLPRTHYTSPETLSWCKSEGQAGAVDLKPLLRDLRLPQRDFMLSTFHIFRHGVIISSFVTRLNRCSFAFRIHPS